ncbi:MAG: CBS domain-containing protein [Desulfomonilaceae bacterium]
MNTLNSHTAQARVLSGRSSGHQVLYFSQLLKRRVCAGKIKDRLGKLTDLVFSLSEPYPQSVGIYIEHGWGKPTQFIPWDKVIRIEDDAIFVQPPPEGADKYPPFMDQPGWILLDAHLMGRTILDTDGRKVEVVNDICLIESRTRLLLVDVDISFNGFLRRIGLGKVQWIKDQLISWKYVQPLSVEDAVATDQVSLSLTRKEILDLPGEDLADVLEELSGEEQQALFTSLDSEKAAETLMETEPRAQRQIIASLRKEKARSVFSELTIPQLADLFTVIPHDQVTQLMELLPEDKATRVRTILAEDETMAKSILSSEFVAVSREARVGDVLDKLKVSGREPGSISYIYVIDPDNILSGVVDLRELVLAPYNVTVGDIMISPVVAAEEDDVRTDLAQMFAKYHYRMIPVVDSQDHLLGTIRYNDIMKGVEIRVKE